MSWCCLSWSHMQFKLNECRVEDSQDGLSCCQRGCTLLLLSFSTPNQPSACAQVHFDSESNYCICVCPVDDHCPSTLHSLCRKLCGYRPQVSVAYSCLMVSTGSRPSVLMGVLDLSSLMNTIVGRPRICMWKCIKNVGLGA